jgi:hypothetical protein
MSTYSYTVEFTDSEIIMLEESLKLMIKKCETELLIEPRPPFYAHKHSAEEVLKRLNSNVTQMSGNNFGN